MELEKGILSLTVVDGKLIRDTEILGRMSPYCTLTFKDVKHRTKVHNYGAKAPKWGDTFTLDVTSPTEELVLRCWDQDLTTSDSVGFVKIKMSSLMINKGIKDSFDLIFENKLAGSVNLESVFVPEGGDKYEEARLEYEEQKKRLEEVTQEKEEVIKQLEQLTLDTLTKQEEFATEKATMVAQQQELLMALL